MQNISTRAGGRSLPDSHALIKPGFGAKRPDPENQHRPQKPDQDTDRFKPFAGKRSRVKLPITPLRQPKNGCGTTALAMILNAFGQPVTPAELDQRYRKHKLAWTPVQTVLKAARKQGLYAQVYNRSGFDEIRQHLEAGHLLMAAPINTNVKRFGFQSHYVVIHGFSASPRGRRYVDVADPGTGKSRLQKYESLEERWKDPRYLGMNVGFSNTLIAISRQNDLPPGRAGKLVQSADQVGYAGSQILNAWSDLKQRNFKVAAEEVRQGLRHGIPGMAGFIRNKLGRNPG